MIAAVIVLYHPELSLLHRLLESVAGQVDLVLAIDNTPAPPSEVRELLAKRSQPIRYEALGNNKGIAVAQNIGIQLGLGAGASHILLLDQDSSLPPGMVPLLLQAEGSLLSAGRRVAAVGPVFIDEKTGEKSMPFRQGYLRTRKISVDEGSMDPVETEYIIASGSLIRREVLEDVGMMLDRLFIDLVDIEWGLRAKRKGYRSYIVPNLVLRHSVGDRAVRMFGREIYVHSDTRNYYRIRNGIYLLRLRHMGMPWRVSTLLRIPKYVVIYSLLSEHRVRTLTILFRACLNGLRGQSGRYC
ncbi:MAG: glycosyltransferase family 2 protein [Acidobacteriota bacterium]